MNGTTVTETKTVYSKPSDSSVMLSFTSSSSHVTTIKQTSTYAIHVSKTIASAPSHALASALPTPVLSSKSSEIAIPQGVSSTPSVVAAPSQPSLDSCPIICKPTVCTDNVVLRGTPTLLVYLCSGTKAPHGESTPASVAMASSSSTVGRSTMWFSSTPIGSSEIGSSSTLGISSAMPSSSKVHSTVFVTVTEITTVTPVSTTIATPTSMELTTTITHHLTSTLFKTHTIFPHPTSIPSGVFWTGFPSGYFPTHPAGLSGTYSVNSARIAARNVLTVTVTAPPSTVFENITATPTHPVSVSTDNVMGPSVTVTQNMKKGDAAEIAEVSVIAFCMVILAAVLLL
ncbi:uncharacterized protein BDR25DRAFT_302374 [Lindgomyces ingoldianus]|uniref:Uncharacterized protein n=1 Tax=Lindgomyces ingoldianus TaxID=673940 RepID=A0ACB6R2J8_9PLEO|nr:uncharacterized protein BDR25DRAFT_302374 [Lindgomyces ingoldianus]KAF2473508.1 hypothetical protein BDR25DRAFT_302374 [Lindgomyces ingoldianus]